MYINNYQLLNVLKCIKLLHFRDIFDELTPGVNPIVNKSNE